MTIVRVLSTAAAALMITTMMLTSLSGCGGSDQPVSVGITGSGIAKNDTGTGGITIDATGIDAATTDAKGVGIAADTKGVGIATDTAGGDAGEALKDTAVTTVKDAGTTDAGATTTTDSTTDTTTDTTITGPDTGALPPWPTGPEDNITGVSPGAAKYTVCNKAWGCAFTACQIDPKRDCMDVCSKTSSKTIVGQMTNFSKCFRYVCHDKWCKSGDKKCLMECMWSRCSGFAMQCNPDKTSGGKLCGSALGCFNSCKGADTFQCLSACYTQLGKSAQSDFGSLWSCIATNPSKQLFAGCWQQSLTCVSGGTTGKSSCLEIAKCDGACEKPANGDKFPCTAKCYGTGTSQAQSRYSDLMSCVVKAQDKDGKDGPGPACGAAVATCAGSPPDGTAGALGCQDIAPCEQKCRKINAKDDSCTMQCLAKASQSEAVKWWNQAMCWNGCTKSCEGKAQSCQQSCFQTSCKKQSLACLG